MKVQFGLEAVGTVQTFEEDYVTLIIGKTQYRIRVVAATEGGDGKTLSINKSAGPGRDELVVIPRSSNVIYFK